VTGLPDERENTFSKIVVQAGFRSERVNSYFNTSEQSSAFNHEYGNWASEPKASTPNGRAHLLMRVESDFLHDHKIESRN
jgi:hypothetical protein